MTETTPADAPKAAQDAATRARLWEMAEEARALAQSHSAAEEALDRLDDTDPPPREERDATDADHALVAPPDPMPEAFDDGTEPDGEPPEPEEPTVFTWGVLARGALALVNAVLVAAAGAHLLQGPFRPPVTVPWEPALLWVPGALTVLATAGAAHALRRTASAAHTAAGSRRGDDERWSVPAALVFVCGAATTAVVLALWTLVWTGDPPLTALGAAVGVIVSLALVPPRAPDHRAETSPGSLMRRSSERGAARERRRENRRVARRWRQERGRARAAIRAHTRAWQSVHHRCHAEVESGNAQAERLAQALYDLRGDMFGRELPGDSDDAPAVPPLVGTLEVVVHNLTVYHPDRLTRRLRENGERAAGEV
ncbi:hypothetical protein [Nocardiopsis sp. LOL_012]|uniref:hypothetical protein n=1 Tax=Nocardiopsis sp. LOL_012 TaxID=3345409 RepID=UPI003A838CE4